MTVMKIKRHRIKKIVFGLLMVVLCITLGAGAFFGVVGFGMYREAVLEKSLAERIEEVRSKQNFTVYSELPQFYIDATISVEDHRFESHCGIDLVAIGRAAWKDLKALSFVEGGSTITQQIAKNMLFTQDKKIERKVAEVFAAFEMESKYSKEEIFELYVNTAYFGSGYYGIYQASVGYFGKEPLELSDYEAAALAGLPNAPSLYSPKTDIGLSKQRTQQVLKSMVKNKVITQDKANEILPE